MQILAWDEYFMGLAHLSRMRSKDPSMRVGAVIVNAQKRIVGIGYNGFPDRQGHYNGEVNNDVLLPWGKSSKKLSETKHSYVIHGEENAIINATTRDFRGCKIYVTHFPCNKCAAILVQNGIEELIYDEPPKPGDKHIEMYEAAYKVLYSYGVKVRQIETDLTVRVTKKQRE